MAGYHRARRNGRQGIVLLAVLAGVVLVAAIAGTLRARAGATSAVLGRLAELHRGALAEVSVINRARIGTAGRTVEMVRDGYRFEVRVTDVEGLVDLYLAPGPVLRLLPGGGALVAARDGMLAGLAPGDRYLSEEQTMAVMGLDATERARLAPFVTQRARTGEITPALAPEALRSGAALLAEQDRAGGDLAEVSVRRLP